MTRRFRGNLYLEKSRWHIFWRNKTRCTVGTRSSQFWIEYVVPKFLCFRGRFLHEHRSIRHTKTSLLNSVPSFITELQQSFWWNRPRTNPTDYIKSYRRQRMASEKGESNHIVYFYFYRFLYWMEYIYVNLKISFEIEGLAWYLLIRLSLSCLWLVQVTQT